MDNIIEYDDPDLTKLFIGRKVVKADTKTGTLTLDNGTELKIIPNEGCGGCVSGYYELERLATFDNVITNVDHVRRSGVKIDDLDEDYEDWIDQTYSIFVYSEGIPIGQEVVHVAGTDGNGYYGTGYEIQVTRPKV